MLIWRHIARFVSANNTNATSALTQAHGGIAGLVVVAADDQRIVAACLGHGVQALLTRTDHASGSDRLAEACALLGLDGDDVVVNVQGDEPLIDPALVRRCAELLAERPDCVMSTAAHPLVEVLETMDAAARRAAELAAAAE